MNRWTRPAQLTAASLQTGRVRRASVLLWVMCALVLALGATSASALAPTNSPLAGSNFQGGDGNQSNPAGDVSNPPDGVNDIDWQALAATIPTAFDDSTLDTMFVGGNKETQPGLWAFTTKAGGVTPGKDNLLAAWSTSAPNVSGPPNTYLNLAFTRQVSTGNTFNTFELNQLAQTWNNGSANISCRTTGDLLISYEVASGGTPVNVDIVVYRWTSSTVDAATGCGKTGTLTPLDPAPNAEGAMNTGPITNYLAPGTLGSSFGDGQFGEASLNLTGILTKANVNPCTNFGQISMHTRSSTSIDSQLQDYISPSPVLVRSCSLAIKKTGSTPKHDGDPETFNYEVTNDGTVPVTVSKASNTGVTDDRCAPVTYVSGDTNNDGNVDTNETWKFTCAYTVAHADENAQHDIINTGTVHGSVASTLITKSTTYTTHVIHPAIDVTKVASESAVHAGDTIHYTVTVKNTGDTSLTVSPTDTGCSPFSTASFTLAAGATQTINCTYVAGVGDGGSYNNQACATGVDVLGGAKGTVSDCDDVTVKIYHPGIAVTKDADLKTAHVGDTITYTITVENTGDVDLTVTPADLGCSGLNSAAFALAVGATKTLGCTHVAAGGDGASYKNEACATGVDAVGGTAGTVTDCGDVTTDLIHPQLHVVKSGTPTTAHDGDKVVYSYDVTNTGDTPLGSINVVDDKCAAVTYDSGDTNSDGKLDLNETWKYHCDYTVLHSDENASSDIVNTVTADGTDKLGQKVSDDDKWTTHVVHPGLAIDKKERLAGDPTYVDGPIQNAHVGDKLEYEMTVTNPGDTPMAVTSFADSQCDAGTLTGPTGDANSNNLLDTGETWVWHCSHVLLAGDPKTFTNTASVNAHDTFGGAPITKTDHVDATIVADASVEGVKFHDLNANGVRDGGEGGLGGWTFYVDYNGNGVHDAGEPSAVSAADGSWKIGGIQPGTYAVREVGQTGWTCSFPATCEYDLTFNPSDAKTGADFGNWEPATVSGTKYEDKNSNGVFDAGDGPLAGVTIYVDYNGNGVLDTGEPAAVSAADGSWTITGVKPGTFKVLEVPYSNYSCTQPATTCAYNLTFQAGDVQTGKVFGNAPPAQIVQDVRVTPGTANLAGPTGCTAKAFNARVRGTKVQSVTFILDGKVIKRFTKINASGLYSVRVDPAKMRIGVHRLVVNVTFQKGSATKPKTMRLSFQRCARKLAAPRFTG